MNERIKELAEQAGIEFTYDPTETPMRAFVECWEDELDKFAELIVRECASKVDWIYAEKGITIDGVNFTVTQGDLIKQHFGVEL